MQLLNWKRHRVSGILLVLVAMGATGCNFLLGPDTVVSQQGFSFRLVETLRNEASLRGESFRELAFNTNPATTLQQPNSVYADAFRVYVTDRAQGGRIFIFNRGERTATILDQQKLSAVNADMLLTSATSTVPTEARLKISPNINLVPLVPAGIAVDASGIIYVSDSQQGKVFGYDRNGRSYLIIGKSGDLGKPAGLASDHGRNRLYVADTFDHRVKVFSLTGDRIFEIGASGRAGEDFQFPGAIALDADGNLFVLDTLRKRVHVYDPDGKFVKAISLSGSMPGHAIKPKGLALDSDGHLYVVDSVSNNILLFDREGIFLSTWGRTGILAGEFWTPSGIFIDSRDTIYIADRTNGRVQTFQYTK